MINRQIIILLLVCFPFLVIAQKKDLQKLDATLGNYQYPFEVKYLDLNNQRQPLKMAYMDVKPQNYNGKNVVLLHGKNFNGAYWETTVRELTKSGFRVVVPDQIGFGKSTKPQNFQYSFQQLATNTKTLLDTLGIAKTAVLGHSMGGMLATRFALMYPQVTEKLILENPIGLEDYKRFVPYHPVDWWYKNELDQNYDKIKQYQLTSYYDGKWKPGYDKWVNQLAGWTVSEDYPLIAWNSALTYDMIFSQPVVYEFQYVQSPTLLIIGTRDRTALGKPLAPEKVRNTMGQYQELGKKTQDRIPNARLVELENIGHLPHIESFNQFIKPLLAFLNE
jgi:pimeloyl-ACP methyl ester carboxylesterase